VIPAAPVRPGEPVVAVKRILVVDDEEVIRDLLRDALASVGWEADTAADAATALEMVRDTLYDALVLDFVLPDMNGIQLHSEIRRIDDELARHTLFISGIEQPDERLAYYGSAGGFLPKPFDMNRLLSEVAQILGEVID